MNIGGIELATPGDIIVGGLSFAGGFAVDAFFFSGGATSAEVGGATMAGALGVKYAIQKMFFGGKKTPLQEDVSDDDVSGEDESPADREPDEGDEFK